MADTLENLLNSRNLPPLEPPAGLASRILERVYAERMRFERRKAALFVAVNALSLAGFIWSAKFAFGELYNSEFGAYLSLVLSDAEALVHYPREFILLLAESLPVSAVLVFGAASLITLIALKILAQSVRMVFGSPGHYQLMK